MLTTETALAELRRLASAAGFDNQRPNLRTLWTAVKAWAALTVDGAPERVQDLLLFECSRGNAIGDAVLQLSADSEVRQFMVAPRRVGWRRAPGSTERRE